MIVGGDSLASAAVPLVSSLAMARGNGDLLVWCRFATSRGDEPVSVRVSAPFVQEATIRPCVPTLWGSGVTCMPG